MGSRDILIALALTGMLLLTDHLFNEQSALCIIPQIQTI